MLSSTLFALLSAHSMHTGSNLLTRVQGLCACRLDVLLTADQPVSNYWISLTQQYRLGAPMGFAVLHYNGSAADTLPPNPNPQPTNITLFTASDINEVRTSLHACQLMALLLGHSRTRILFRFTVPSTSVRACLCHYPAYAESVLCSNQGAAAGRW